jgi:hypothetical protein
MGPEVRRSIHAGIAVMHSMKSPKKGHSMGGTMEPIVGKVEERYTQSQLDPYRKVKQVKKPYMVIIQPLYRENSQCCPEYVTYKKGNIE